MGQTPYKYNGFGPKWAKNIINLMILVHNGCKALQTQWFWATMGEKRYKYNGFGDIWGQNLTTIMFLDIFGLKTLQM